MAKETISGYFDGIDDNDLSDEDKENIKEDKESTRMIITAVYIYGIAIRAWEFSWSNTVICFGADMMLAWRLSSSVNVSVANKISDEEKFYWSKRTQVEELRRVELDRQLYGRK